MKRRLAALAVMGALCATPAAAECLDTALQSTVDAFNEAVRPNANATAGLARIDALVAACPADPYVQRIAAQTYATVPAPNAAESVKRLARSRELFRQMWITTGNRNWDVRTAMGAAGPLYIGFNDLYEIESQVRDLLFQAEQLSGQLAPEDMPVGQGAPVRACALRDSSDAQRAWFWIKDRGDHPGAFNQLDRTIAMCAATPASANAELFAYRAKALVASARRGVDKPGAVDKLNRARADAATFLRLRGQHELIYWSKSDETELDALLIKATGVPPRETWFKPPLLSDPIVEKYIGLALDAAWAEDAKTGRASLYKTYRGVVTQLYALAAQSQDVRAARTALFRAASAHATGGARAPENAGLPAPPDYLWKWTDPDYVAPPQPAPQ
jgi:hypothetical protein